MSIRAFRLLPGLALVIAALVMPASPSYSQTPAEAAFALQGQITAEVQEQLAENTRGRFTNGGSSEAKIAASGSQNTGSAASVCLVNCTEVQPGPNYFTPSYCFLSSASTPVEIVVFPDASYVFSSNPVFFPILASACPIAVKVSVNVTTINGKQYNWDAFSVIHN
jgi:hypothetical protein